MERGPRPAQTRRREGTEVPPVRADSFDDHEVFVEPAKRVDLHSFEEVVGSVGQDSLVGCAEAAREVADGHTGAVDVAIVAREEEVHVTAVTDEDLVDDTGARGNCTAEERLRGRPAVGVAGVGGGVIGERGWTPLVGEDPGALGCEVEHGWGDGGGGHFGLSGGA